MALEETIIQLKHMGKEFKTANGPVKALDDINLEIRRGEIFGIIGLSGAGKSTLVRCINMLEIPTSGQVLFEGENLAALNDAGQRKARQSMGMIFQQFNLLAQRNILRNVCFPMEIAGVPKRQSLTCVGGALRDGERWGFAPSLGNSHGRASAPCNFRFLPCSFPAQRAHGENSPAGNGVPRAFRLLRKVLRIRSIAKTPAVQSNTTGAVFGKITFPLYQRNTH